MQSLSTFTSVASLFCDFAYYDAYYQYCWHFLQGCAGVIIQGRWKWSGRRGRYCEERRHSKGGPSMVSFATCFLTSSTFSF